MWKNLSYLFPLSFVLIMIGCDTNQEYSWAFAQNMDTTFKANEYCRTSLADTIYNDVTKDKLFREVTFPWF